MDIEIVSKILILLFRMKTFKFAFRQEGFLFVARNEFVPLGPNGIKNGYYCQNKTGRPVIVAFDKGGVEAGFYD